MTKTIDGLDTLTEETRTMLKDGMIPCQNSLLGLTKAQKEEMSSLLLRTSTAAQDVAVR